MGVAKKLMALSNANNLTFIQHTPYHIQIKGLHTINIYESKKTYYINGTNGKRKFDPDDLGFLIKLAMGETDIDHAIIKDERKKFGTSKRLRIWQKNPTCYWCKELIPENDISLEHIIPLVKGGSNRDDNLAVSHKLCNRERGESIGVKNEKSKH